MPLMALVQLSIRNKTQTTFPLKTIVKEARISPGQDDPANRVRGYWIRGRGQSSETPDCLNLIPEFSRVGVFIVFVGGGATPGDGLCMYEP